MKSDGTSTRAFHVSGQMSVEEMVDRYHIQCRPIRDLLVDYLREFQVSADYNTVLGLSYERLVDAADLTGSRSDRVCRT
jgi:hypothetical protein